MTIYAKITSILGVLALTVGVASAQHTYDDNRHHIYPSVTHIEPSDPSLNGEGYVIASTLPNGPVRTRIQRLEPSGVPIWQFYLDLNGNDTRITHVEKYISPISGDLEYLLVGSIIGGPNNNRMYLAKMDDNGNILLARQYGSNVWNSLKGIKAVYSQNINEFVAIASESNGASTTDDKRMVVMGIDFSSLNISWNQVYDTPNSTYDYDFPNEIIEAVPGRFLVVGTANENSISVSEPAASCIYLNPAGVIWNTNYVTTTPGFGHSDNAASVAVINNVAFVLGNSSAMHFFNITGINLNTGNIVYNANFGDGTLDKYGFTIRRSISNPSNLIIGGYKYTYNSDPFDQLLPFMGEFDPGVMNINWFYTYKAQNPGLGSYAENQMLYKRALGQFPFYYNSMFTYKFDSDGYNFLGNEDIVSGEYAIKFFGIKPSGDLYNPNCGMTPNNVNPTQGARFLVNNSGSTTAFFPSGAVTPNQNGYSPTMISCGPVMKRNLSTSVGEANVTDELTVYPNPSTGILTIEGQTLSSIEVIHIYDIQGKLVLEQKIGNTQKEVLNLETLKSGLYIMKLLDEGNTVEVRKLQIKK